MAGGDGLRLFEGAVCLITGGASGIGLSLGKELARRKATVILADRQADVASEQASVLARAGGQASGAELDVTRYPDVEALVNRVADEHGRLDFIFNNAGIGVSGESAYYALSDWMRVLDVNLNGVIHGVHAAYPIMRQQGFGHIVNTASMAGLIPGPGMLSYGVSKHAVVGLSRGLRLEAEGYGVRVSVLCPGVIRTAIIDGGGKFGGHVGPASSKAMQSQFEKLKPMDPDDFARAALTDIARNKGVIIYPKRWRTIWLLSRWIPSLAEQGGRQALKAMRSAPSD